MQQILEMIQIYEWLKTSPALREKDGRSIMDDLGRQILYAIAGIKTSHPRGD